jgi:hypothetical protein
MLQTTVNEGEDGDKIRATITTGDGFVRDSDADKSISQKGSSRAN